MSPLPTRGARAALLSLVGAAVLGTSACQIHVPQPDAPPTAPGPAAPAEPPAEPAVPVPPAPPVEPPAPAPATTDPTTTDPTSPATPPPPPPVVPPSPSPPPPSAPATGLLDLGLSLPWAVGETQEFTGGLHGTNRNAVDFTGGTGQVTAAGPGTARVLCGGAMVRIDHGGGWETLYFHLRGVPAGLDGTQVIAGQVIGRQSTALGTCGGFASGDHLHFGLMEDGQPHPIVGLVLGGWVIEADGADDGSYRGCMRQLATGVRGCDTGNESENLRILNDGTVGAG